MSPNLSTSFWTRMGLKEKDRDVCVRAIQLLYPDHCVEDLEDQGYCSFTLTVSASTPKGNAEEERYIVQIRPRQHSVDLAIADAARKTYGHLAPRFRELACALPGGLKAVEMERLSGVPLSKVNVHDATWEQQVTLVESLAKFVAMAWPAFTSQPSQRHIRADTPTEGQWLEQNCTGKVGRIIVSKLRNLAAHLPSEALRERARNTLARLLAIDSYPVVLNHGDLIQSNILIDPASWAVTGLVDWAEAEWLPFGTCLYGVEHLLGSLGTETGGGSPEWRYRERSGELRRVFWQALERGVPELKGRQKKVECVRDVGVLLWYGYAWDEGAIDRVVNEVDDAEEVACLRAFLGIK
ncbi:hypothetical protein BU23DRAFT_489401 [Bimuria novae-zelandiae CBS 107.79]|uniref:Aminoglycoside phosphotransferase domain-containing protein n=1 Tax=Bimuria novae-zelandiae CBS 107.79 TaxID=1447943 RepID=A0A6A5UNT2_9PLEO|nr:hypothetical protein BU23DRAFT_489401 [Bimuria novae-zelandiae CBS 107.79]